MVIDSKTWAPSRPPVFPYSVHISSKVRWKGGITKWLLENIGISARDWDYSWYKNELQFKTEEDRVKFILRWM